ncbi:hypothetical protein PULV_a3939 [Pseudoalteromonas ulvae UL12]|uniref:hypothetical protein n=1 Tax=Pseudoalteromonas ulvae TaxID=107327 RepID=UPI00186B6C77|nr:hypothetical protein [Pseudoalteromonas ulvae]MBE0362135.1 hypothetical protein [Pseudoalteromonas ulvae UL12]
MSKISSSLLLDLYDKLAQFYIVSTESLTNKTFNIGTAHVNDPESFILSNCITGKNINPLINGLSQIQIKDEDSYFIDLMHLGVSPQQSISEMFCHSFREWLAPHVRGKKLVVRYLFGCQSKVTDINNDRGAKLLARLVTELGGQFYVAVFNGSVASHKLTDKLKFINLDLQILSGEADHPIGGWNHAKMIAVNDIAAITGGHNFWDDYFAKENDPVKVADTSLLLHGGGPTQAAHSFADHLWKCIETELPAQSSLHIFQNNAFVTTTDVPFYNTPPKPNKNEPKAHNQVQYLSVGKLGAIDLYETLFWKDFISLGNLGASVYWEDVAVPQHIVAHLLSEELEKTIELASRNAVFSTLLLNRLYNDYANDLSNVDAAERFIKSCQKIMNRENPNPHDSSIYVRNAITRQARASIKVSQQKLALPFSELGQHAEVILPYLNAKSEDGLWAVDYLFSVGDALLNNYNQDSIISVQILLSTSKGDSGYKDSLGIAKTKRVLRNILRALCKDSKIADTLVNQNVEFKELDFDNLTLNHSKFWLIDDTYCYLGSDNIYPGFLQEYGYVLKVNGDNNREVKAAITKYWNSYWLCL